MKSLSADALRQYRDAGYYAPVRAISSAEAAATRRHLEAYEQHSGGLRGPLRHKTHLLFTWLDDLIRNPAILDAGRGCHRPEYPVLGHRASSSRKRTTPAIVSWHQDSAPIGGWIRPISSPPGSRSRKARLENGAMRVIPGSHTRRSDRPSRYLRREQSALSRGQEIAVEVDEAQARMLELQPGEMSLHHVRLIHGSRPEPLGQAAASALPSAICRPMSARSSARATARRWSAASTRSAISCRSRRPDADLSPAARAFHAQIMASPAS